MSIRYYSLKHITPVSKPRGQIGKYGNITHSSGNYRKFQNEVSERLKQLNFSIPGGFFTLAYIFYMGKKKGQQNDITNMCGALEDILVSEKYIIDDNWKILSRCWIEALPADEFSITLLIVQNQTDMVYYMTARERLLQQFSAS